MKQTFQQFKESLCKSNSEWNTYAKDKLTVSYVCALVNSGVAYINNHDQIRIKNQYRKID